MKRLLIIGACILFVLVDFWVFRQYQDAKIVARESAQRALFVEAKVLLQAYFSDTGKYPEQLTELPFTYTDGVDKSIFQHVHYSSNGSGYLLRTVTYHSHETLEVEMGAQQGH